MDRTIRSTAVGWTIWLEAAATIAALTVGWAWLVGLL